MVPRILSPGRQVPNSISVVHWRTESGSIPVPRLGILLTPDSARTPREGVLIASPSHLLSPGQNLP